MSDDVVVASLRERFKSDTILHQPRHLQVHVSGGTGSVMHKYDAEYQCRDTCEHKDPLSPHIFQLAHNVLHAAQDQSIIFRLQAASPKTTHHIKTLLELSPGKKGSKLATQVHASEFVLESFGNMPHRSVLVLRIPQRERTRAYHRQLPDPRAWEEDDVVRDHHFTRH
ncbi:hypothetical protein B0H11DRAFT_2263135 [Mycena galericulata]|nr:hypothetical protein B0H11DRAFT_2263135 [Mycena galericulata]